MLCTSFLLQECPLECSTHSCFCSLVSVNPSYLWEKMHSLPPTLPQIRFAQSLGTTKGKIEHTPVYSKCKLPSYNCTVVCVCTTQVQWEWSCVKPEWTLCSHFLIYIALNKCIASFIVQNSCQWANEMKRKSVWLFTSVGVHAVVLPTFCFAVYT